MAGVKDALAMAASRRLLRANGRSRRLVGLAPDRRAISEYELMQADNQKASPLYQPGKFWSEINSDFRDLIWAGALKTLRNQYFNRRFSGPEPCSLQVYGALLWLYHQQLVKIDGEFVSQMSDPPVGGTQDQVQVAGRPVSLDLLQSIEEALTIRGALRAAQLNEKPEVIVELGAGYGRLAHVCRRLWPECTYVILDLPEALLCAQTWLDQVFPGEVVFYSDSRETPLDRKTLSTRKVWCLGSHDIERLDARAADVFVNIYSFAEMPRESVDNYYAHLQRITRDVFYTKQRRVENNVVDGTMMREGTYPELAGAREILRRSSSLYEQMFEAAYALKALA